MSIKKYKYYVVIHKDKRSVVNSWKECKDIIDNIDEIDKKC